MYRDLSQWTMIRRRVLDDGISRRQIVCETGISRGTIRKILLHKCPQPYHRRTFTHPKLGPHIDTINKLIIVDQSSMPELPESLIQIYRRLQREEGYEGSYSTLCRYVKNKSLTAPNPINEVWNDAYALITSLPRLVAIHFMKTISCEEGPPLSPSRMQTLFDEIAQHVKSRRQVPPRSDRKEADTVWINRVLCREQPSSQLADEFKAHPGFQDLIRHLYGSRLSHRTRAMIVLAHLHGISIHTTASALNISRLTVRRARQKFHEQGVAGIFVQKRRAHLKIDDDELKSAIFSTLHEPPSNYGINRTSWIMPDLCGVLAKMGKPACRQVVAAITKSAGYKWRKARVVLTSNDTDYSEKLSRIRSILSTLPADEAFFSIDEFGPFAVKAKSGRSLTAPGEQRLVQQWQKSKGCLILTAAIELSSNQITHFYSAKKNTEEMIRMMELLVVRYKDKRKLYLSWDAASWHISKKLTERIAENNQMVYVTDTGPLVETVPLPARAQFLNVIESIFSGMARAIIHNSDYQSSDDARAAIDRYFADRNHQFAKHPHRAGNKIWGKERVPAIFSSGNNCKDPRYR